MKPLSPLTFSKHILASLLLLCAFAANSQVYTNKPVGKKNQHAIDSIKSQDYPYVLPIWGEKATKRGFMLPYSAGMSVQYLWQQSDLIIENLKVGFNNNEPYDLKEVVRFNSARSIASGINLRPDIWLFPFLNVYGILAKSRPNTLVDYSIYVPDASGNWKEAIRLNSEANFEATTFGFGITPTFGVGGGWIALDMNFTWSDIPELKEPAFAYIFGPRIGKSFRFKNPNSNIAFWVGGFRLKLNTGTSGSIPLKEVIPVDGLQQKVDAGLAKVEASNQDVANWWTNLSPIEQRNPANIARYEAANRAITAAGGMLSSMDDALNDENTATVQYSLDKRPKDMWNFVVGTQFQYNKHWMIRLEYGFLGSRTQFIAGLQYRFGL
ncbi:MAG TPA: hypothetical protein PLQ93_11625 [Bacteroidia bacterium]|nr:hypothetical protein [Bacteroidia bacterium]